MEFGYEDEASTSVPPRCTSALGPTPTHTVPATAASAVGCPSRRTVAVIALRCRSILEMLPEYWLATHTDPSEMASADGPLPTGIVAATVPVPGLILETVESRL